MARSGQLTVLLLHSRASERENERTATTLRSIVPPYPPKAPTTNTALPHTHTLSKSGKQLNCWRVEAFADVMGVQTTRLQTPPAALKGLAPGVELFYLP